MTTFTLSSQTLQVKLPTCLCTNSPEPFELSCVDQNIVKLESIFIDDNVTNTKVASRFNKLAQAVNALNKTKQAKSKSQQIV